MRGAIQLVILYLWNQQTDFQSFTGFVQGAYTIPAGVTSVELKRIIHTNNSDVDLYWTEASSTGQDGLIQAHVWEIKQWLDFIDLWVKVSLNT